jgi:hypothetical protein
MPYGSLRKYCWCCTIFYKFVGGYSKPVITDLINREAGNHPIKLQSKEIFSSKKYKKCIQPKIIFATTQYTMV